MSEHWDKLGRAMDAAARISRLRPDLCRAGLDRLVEMARGSGGEPSSLNLTAEHFAELDEYCRRAETDPDSLAGDVAAAFASRCLRLGMRVGTLPHRERIKASERYHELTACGARALTPDDVEELEQLCEALERQVDR